MRYKDKIVLITGSGSGIGKAAAIAFAKEGANLIVSDINKENGLNTVSEIINNNGKATFFEADVSNYQMVVDLMNFIVDKFGRLDVAINNAGIGGDYAKIADMTLESWDKTMLVNSTGVFYCIKKSNSNNAQTRKRSYLKYFFNSWNSWIAKCCRIFS